MFLNKERPKEVKSDIDTIEEQAIALYSHVKELSILKYESELRREDSLIQQSGQMQAAFSFLIVALFMATPILIEYRGDKLTIPFFVVALSTIVLCLLGSLVFASMAQRRVLKQAFSNIPEIEDHISKNYKTVLKESSRIKQWVQVVGDVQVSLHEVNNRRILYIRMSMACFFTSIAFIVIWYFIALAKII